jgi:hypothetical protein
MTELLKVIQREQWRELAREGEARQFAKAVFTDWRNLYSASLCAYIRLHDETARRNALFPNAKPFVVQGPSRDWCNAAVHILTVGEEEIADRFLRGTPELKDRMVRAALNDGGMLNLMEHFVELPE